MTSSDKRARRIAAGGVLVVAMTAAVISFTHVRTVAVRAGEGELTSWLLPISIDGAVVAAVSVLLADSRAGRRPRLLTWLLLGLGLSASLAANVASASPTPTARVVAGWPPLALALGIEVLAGLARRSDFDEPPAGKTDSQLPAAAAGSGASVNGRVGRRASSIQHDPIHADNGRVPGRQRSFDDPAAVEVIKRLDRAEPSGRASRLAIQNALGCGGSRAARLADLARELAGPSG